MFSQIESLRGVENKRNSVSEIQLWKGYDKLIEEDFPCKTRLWVTITRSIKRVRQAEIISKLKSTIFFPVCKDM